MTLLMLACLLLIVTAFAGYPLCLRVRRVLRPRPWQQAPYDGRVAVVIAAHNEGERIAARLDNLLAQDFDHQRLRIVLVSDGSQDDTLAVAQAWQQAHAADIAMSVIEQQPSQGKPAALNRALATIDEALVVFADARQRFAPDVITRLVENFADPQVGACSGELLFDAGDDGDIGEAAGLYWRLEKGIRQDQALTGSVMGVTGAIYALRRELFRPLPTNTLVDDLATPLRVMAAGYRVVFDGRARAWDQPPAQGAQEYRRKLRTLAGVWQCVPAALRLVVAGQVGLALRFVAHKLSRLLVPWAMLVLLLGCTVSDVLAWQVLAVLQWCGYVLVGLAAWSERIRRLPLVSTGYFFVLLNLAAGASLLMVLMGRHDRLWQRRAVGEGS